MDLGVHKPSEQGSLLASHSGVDNVEREDRLETGGRGSEELKHKEGFPSNALFMYTCVYTCDKSLEEGVTCPGPAGTDNCGLPGVGAGSPTLQEEQIPLTIRFCGTLSICFLTLVMPMGTHTHDGIADLYS